MALQHCVRVNVCLKSHTLAQVYLDLHNIPVFPIQHWPSFHYDWQTILPVAPATVSTLFQSLEAISKAELGGDYMVRTVNAMFKLYTNLNVPFCPNMNTGNVKLSLGYLNRHLGSSDPSIRYRSFKEVPTTIYMAVVVSAVLILSG
ncbi:hypothetical protein BCR33DRAFT_839663 [Rhizoclosmatium globosum]|uniref:Uncharacterized protein n=1 Tax=Rhizoclosmatium globosum TaxID=329046 RepID=A0A1Y2BD43_9FUNG|nr:hypothetical protein BCR33DRAFT_839663 [Rhizoclosmatium globosum]|eukprot:ORY32460.1 hypothetical protein BCR33DRAFT_839663 [Rhizoclosmatium globosum]